MKIVTAEEMRAIDRATTEKYGVASLTLMENAGAAVAEFALKHFEFEAVCAVCGRGNNGGDGFVAARKLHEAGKKVSVIVLAKGPDELRGDAAEMFRKLPVECIWAGDEERLSQHDVLDVRQANELVLDAIVGTGFKPPLEGLARRAVQAINENTAPVVSVDLPSGAYSDSFLPAKGQGFMARSDGVITFTAPKPVHVFGGVTEGPIAVADIGSPNDLVLDNASLKIGVTPPVYLGLLYGLRETDAHKGDFGHILVIGGSLGKAGAAAMAGMAALRSGAGLVTVACPRSVQPAIAGFAPEMMTEALPETDAGTIAESALERIEALLEKKDAVVLGPGLGRHPDTERLVHKLVAKIGGATRLVLDADGLNAFAGHAEELAGERLLIVTPHPGEMARLTGEAIEAGHQGRIRIAREFAKKHKAITVLKGHRTVTASPGGEVWINMSGNPGMAKGGSGDVLSGIIAAAHTQMQGGFGLRQSPESGRRIEELRQLAEQGNDAARHELEEISHNMIFDAYSMITALGVHLHGLAGDVARDLCGEASMLATDITDNIGEAIAVTRRMAEAKFLYLQL